MNEPLSFRERLQRVGPAHEVFRSSPIAIMQTGRSLPLLLRDRSVGADDLHADSSGADDQSPSVQNRSVQITEVDFPLDCLVTRFTRLSVDIP